MRTRPALLALLLLAASCADDGTAAAPGGGGGTGGGGAPTGCALDADCAASELCFQGDCRARDGEHCTTDAHCDAGEHCALGACLAGTACTADDVCPTGESCQGGLCAPDARTPCTSDEDCPAGASCDGRFCGEALAEDCLVYEPALGEGAVPEGELFFGSAPNPGDVRTVTATVTNLCTRPIDVLQATFESSTSPEFSVASEPSLPARLEQGAAVALEVTYAPVDLEEELGGHVLTISSNDRRPTARYALVVDRKGSSRFALTAEPRALEPLVAAHDFGAVALGGRVEVTWFLQNGGTGNRLLRVRTISIEGSDAFTVEPTVGAATAPIALAPRQSCTIDSECGAFGCDAGVGLCRDADGGRLGVTELRVRFSPTEARAERATLVLEHDEGAEDGGGATRRHEVVLTGGGGAPQALVVEPLRLDLPELEVGGEALATLRLRNTGDRPLAISSLALDAGENGLSVDALPSTSLPAGASQTVTIRSLPTIASGPFTDTLRIASDDPARPELLVPITGSAVDPSAVVLPTSVDFGAVSAAAPRVCASVTLSNAGSGTLRLTGAALSPGSDAAFSLEAPPPLPLDVPQVGQPLSVCFTRQAAGPRSGALALQTSDRHAPTLVVPLSATGLDDCGLFYVDLDRDGFGDASTETTACAAPPGYVAVAGDCDDARADVNPGATERCDGVDNRCDGGIDEGLQLTFFVDADGDGAGDPLATVQACGLAAGLAASGDDCDDTRGDVRPGAQERCNGLDDDCSAATADGAGEAWLGQPCDGADDDGCADGGASCAAGLRSCTEAGPGRVELCNGQDDDCDGLLDEGGNPCGGVCPLADAPGAPCDSAADSDSCADDAFACAGANGTTCAEVDTDVDGDGFSACGDCDDADPLRNAAAAERCNGLDDDCDGTIDEGNNGCGGVCALANVPGSACDAAGDLDGCLDDTYVCAGANLTSCTDLDADADDDGFSSGPACAADCDDGNAARFPGATESCNGLDDDCDLVTDEGNNPCGGACALANPPGAACDAAADADSCADDAYVCAGANATSCGDLDTDADDDGYAACGDCDDGDPLRNAGAAERCNGLDDDCDGTVDEGGNGCGGVCALVNAPGSGCDAAGDLDACLDDAYACAGANASSCADVDTDVDGDGFSAGASCAADCDDGDAARFPGAAERCNGLDDDCDGTADEGANPCGGACALANAPGTACDAVTDADSCADDAYACAGRNTTSCAEIDTDADDDGFSACGDCDDTDPLRSPSAGERCNGLDDDCDGTVDEGGNGCGGVCALANVPGSGCDSPADLDGCLDDVAVCAGANATSCADLDFDVDGDGHSAGPSCTDDCDDADPTRFPGASESCNGLDDDCDLAVDEGNNPCGGACALANLPGAACDFFGLGELDSCTDDAYVCAGANLTACADVDTDLDDDDYAAGAAACGGDCADGDPARNPEAVETCNGVDDDCDGEIDEDGGGCNGLCCNGACTPSSAANCGACGVPCTAGMIVINELHIDPAGVDDTQREWFELYNPGSVAFDLRGFVIRDLGTDSHTITSANPVWLPAGGHLVLGINATFATNGGVTVGYQYSGVSLGNSGDELILQSSLVSPTEFDRVVWPGTFDVAGASKELSRQRQDAVRNDTLSNWCTATELFSATDRGTPNAPNSCNL